MFMRFVVGIDGDDRRELTGVFTEARLLRDEGRLESYEVEWLGEVYAWFNEHVSVPPFSAGKWPWDAVAWYKATAEEPVKRTWDLVALLREHGVAVRVLHSERPGFVLYEDETQVVVDEWLPSAEGEADTPRSCRAVVKRELSPERFAVLLYDGSELTAELSRWLGKDRLQVGDVVDVESYNDTSWSGRCLIVEFLGRRFES